MRQIFAFIAAQGYEAPRRFGGPTMFKSFLSILLFSLFTFSAQSQVWEARNSWSQDWEKKYSEWVLNNWSADFFSRKNLPNGASNPYFGLRTDCADTVYSMRIIFSYEHQLPFAAVDPTGGSQLITEKMTRWNDLKTSTERVRQFLRMAYDTFSTRSLPNDTYPIAINKNTVRPGTLILTTTKNHHSWTVQNILPIGVPHLIFNSVVGAGAGSELKERTSWPNPEWVFEGNFTPSGNAGFRDWRPSTALQTPVWKVPGYSEEQYQLSLSKWVDIVQSRLASSIESNDQKLRRLMTSACVGFTERIAAIKEATQFLKSNGNRCMAYADYDLYSTPNRDHRIFDDLVSLRQAYKSVVNNGETAQVNSTVLQQLKKIFPQIGMNSSEENSLMPPQLVNDVSVCNLKISDTQTLDLAEAKRRLFSNLLSNNPHDGFEYRWGDKKGPSALSQSCQSWDHWAPVFTE